MLFTPTKRKAAALAIFSLVLSSFVSWTHHHPVGDCGCSDEHTHMVAKAISGLDNLPLAKLPKGDCGCTDCELIPPTPEPVQPDHDEDTCSVCRMVYEHAAESIEFSLSEANEPGFDFFVIASSAPQLRTPCAYLTRGPPAISA